MNMEKTEMSQRALVMSLYWPKQRALDTVVMLSPASSLSQAEKHKDRAPSSVAHPPNIPNL